MSSTVDQRSSKLVESQGTSQQHHHHQQQQQQQQTSDVEYAYPPTQAVAMQSGYHPGAGLGGPADAAYQMYGGAGGGATGTGPGGYDATYMAFSGGMMADPSSVWSADPSMAYGGYGPAEYLPYGDGSGGNSAASGQYGMMQGQYDYSGVGWYPAGMDYTAAWGQNSVLPMQQQAKSRFIDYSSGYYDNMSMDNSIIARAGGNVTAQQTGNMAPGTSRYPSADANGYHSMDQAFKSMQLSPTGTAPAENGSERVGNYHEQSAATAASVGGGDVGQYDPNKQIGAPASESNATSGATEANNGNSQQKKSWANVASLPAAKTILPRPKQNTLPRGMLAVSAGVRQEAMMNSRSGGNFNNPSAPSKHPESNSSVVAPVPGQYNPKEFDVSAKGARFFVIKSFSEDDIHRSIKFSIWCSTEYGNKRLDAAYREREGKGPVYLLYSVNGSGHFCGVAVMTSAVDYQASSNVWAQDKWKGTFSVQWIFVKDVPNSQLRHIRLENNEGRPVTNSRDTQEVPVEKGRQVLRIIHQYRHTTSIFDDFQHYEKQLVETSASPPVAGDNNNDSSVATVGNNNSISSSNTTNGQGVNGNRQSASSK